MIRKLLVSSAAIAGIVGVTSFVAPTAIGKVGEGIGRQICQAVPDQCLEWRRSSLEAQRTQLLGYRSAIQEGVRLLDEHAATTRTRLDAVQANQVLLAQREQERRRRGAETLDHGARTYRAADVAAQAQLWDAEAKAFEQVLNVDIANRQAQFARTRESVSLAYSRVDTTVRMIEADLLLNPVHRDLARLNAAADGVGREVRVILDPVRSIIEMPGLPPAREATRAAPPQGAQAFDMDAWLQRMTGRGFGS